MSEDNKVQDSVQPETVSKPVEGKNDFVPKKAYEDVSTDMHKFKQKAKEEAARANALEAQMKAAEEAKMQEEQRWKELYEKREAELNHVQNEVKSERQRYMKSVKLAALKQELGGKIRDEYLLHANIDNIELGEDGLIKADSLHEVANQFRKEHGQLIPPQNTPNITGHAPGSEIGPQEVDYSKMSTRDLINQYAKEKTNQN